MAVIIFDTSASKTETLIMIMIVLKAKIRLNGEWYVFYICRLGL